MPHTVLFEMPVQHPCVNSIPRRIAGQRKSRSCGYVRPAPETVSATVYLDAHAMDRIERVCRDENRRISDVICEAVDQYLRERTKYAFEGSANSDDA